jgi:hypothetical protein
MGEFWESASGSFRVEHRLYDISHIVFSTPIQYSMSFAWIRCVLGQIRRPKELWINADMIAPFQAQL